MLGEGDGKKNMSEDACTAVSQHISNEHKGMMRWRGKRLLNVTHV